MNTSSFLFGVVMGAAASMMMSKKRRAMMSSMGLSSGVMGEKAKDKIMGMAATGFGSTTAGENNNHISKHETNSESPVKSKESNLKMLKDFIRSNPEVKHEVEQILKETHTAIPGL
ncbi:hypothetical protein [Paenibacillus sp. sgz500958]|uniref:hypothetical protein n=1 Tax=Paenibacillus sp. sgz500958 TaxID=3242475 RepID=UPI0036D32243